MQIDGDKLLEWLDVELDLSSGRSAVEKADKLAYGQVKKAIQSGTFDVEEEQSHE